jgi:hypothetical protein
MPGLYNQGIKVQEENQMSNVTTGNDTYIGGRTRNSISSISLKLGVLTIVFFLLNLIVSWFSGIGRYQQIPDPIQGVLWTLLISLVTVAAVSYPIIQSRWTGWKLVVTIFIVVFGIRAFLSQIESLVFLRYLVNILPEQLPVLLLINGFVVALLFAPAAVWAWGKFKSNDEYPAQTVKLWSKDLSWKLIIIGVIYLFVYILFGMFVFRGLAGDAFDAYYTNLQMPAWITPFQIIRGVIWALIALPVIRMMRGSTWQKGLAVALLFSIIMGALLLTPSTVMPERIRLSHLVEVSTSNFVFGWIVVLLLNKKA